MTRDFNCLATGIGSLPLLNADEAAALSLRLLPEAPIWPQMPKRGFREHMDGQFIEALPCLALDEKKQRYYFESAQDLTPELERFFGRYLAKDLAYFRITENHAAGFYGLLRALRAGVPPSARFLKGHITGPLTLGTLLKDHQGRDSIHNDLLFDAAVKGLAMKAAWQIETLKQFGLPVIIFIDEPAMESLGSAFSAVSSVVVAEKLNELCDVIHEAGGIAGIHCCGNADWPLLFRTRTDIVSFDAFGYLDRVLLYPEDIRAFYGRGGTLAWGIVPTGAFIGLDTAAGLASRIESGAQRLEAFGIDRKTILRRCILTPSCGMGGLSPEQAEAILKLLGETAELMKNDLAAVHTGPR